MTSIKTYIVKWRIIELCVIVALAGLTWQMGTKGDIKPLEWIPLLSVWVGLSVLILRITSFRSEQRIALREATLPFFRAWWGVERWLGPENKEITVPQLRKAFYKLVGSPNEEPEATILAKLAQRRSEPEATGGKFGLNQAGDRLKELVQQDKVSKDPTDTDYLRNLTFFYDMIGWLGAHELINVDYILGPMQHHMRRTWWVAKVLVERDRQLRADSWLDPVRHFGFQWLFEQSEKRNQADIMKDRFSGLPLASGDNIAVLKKEIEEDEKRFRAHLRSAGWPTDDNNASKPAQQPHQPDTALHASANGRPN